MNEAFAFRWLGVAGLELTDGTHTLVIDPYFTRFSFLHQWFGRVRPNSDLVRKIVPKCDYILVSHAHWDHLMDVPDLAVQTGAAVYGSDNTCELLSLLGVPQGQIHLIRDSDTLQLGPFRIGVAAAKHGRAPGFGPGRLRPNLTPPLRALDYRMDVLLSFRIQAKAITISSDVGEHAQTACPTDIQLLSPHRDRTYLTSIIQHSQPKVVIPSHWDDFYRPLSKPLKPMMKPPSFALPPFGKMSLPGFQRAINSIDPAIRVFFPKILEAYHLSELYGAPEKT